MDINNNADVILIAPQTPSLENLDIPLVVRDEPRTSDNISLLDPIAEEVNDVIEMYNDINSELKESVYQPKQWVEAKLKQVKTESSLKVETSVLPESVKVVENTITMQIATGTNKKVTTTMEVQFFQDGVIKCKCINPVNPSKFSMELIEKPENLVPFSVENHTEEFPDSLVIPNEDSGVKVTISYSPFNITVTDKAENILFAMNKNKSLMFDKSLSADFSFHTEYIYGLAEHAYNLLLEDTKRDRPYRFFNQDVCAYPVGSKNGVYGAIPIIVSRQQASPTFVSVYWPNASDTYIDIHKSKSEAGNTTSNTFWFSERGNLEFYAFVNTNPVSHFRGFASVVGHCAMPQLFGLGYHQSRYSYKDQKDVLEVSAGFTEHEVPCDSITLDIDHTDGKRYFTWDTELYPDPEGMQRTLASSGRQLVTIADPHIKVDKKYHVYKEAAAKQLTVKTKKGKQFVGKCWPGDSVYLDYLNEETRQHWAKQYSYENYKYSTPNIWAWNDMNEPSVFELPGLAMPLENLHTYKSLEDPNNTFQVEHREVHNIYGLLMSKGTYDGLLKRNKDQNIRPHALSRSCFAGSQKYAAIWTGDTRATWPYLKATVPMLLSLSLCGISYCGGDVGGFIGDPEPELAVRWYQLGTFMPYFRGHSECNCKRREPWLYSPKYFEPIREAIRDRYRILPYYYTAFEEHCRTAVPIMRPIWFDQQAIANRSTMFEQERFMVGSGMLVVPVVEKGKTVVKNFLRGLTGRWYDFYSRQEVAEGQNLELGLERIGCYVKGGHIIPTYDVRSYTKSTKDAKQCNINLYVAVDEEEKSKGKMYFDDGETFDYKKGAFMRKGARFEKDTLTWECEEEAGYVPTNRVTKAVITGLGNRFTEAFLMEIGGKNKQKIQLVKGAGYMLLEFVAMASKNWKIVLN